MSDLTPKQKARITVAYVHYLRAKAELGMQPTADEIRLVEAGVADIRTDFQEAAESLVPPVAGAANAVAETLRPIAEVFDDE